jgi:ankyrin repeat protein
VFATDDYGKSALHLAAGAGLTKVAVMLLEQYPQSGGAAAAAGEAGGTPGADEPEPVNARDKYGWTPLHTACYGGHADVTAALLTQGARAAKPTKTGFTALHAAVAVGPGGYCRPRHRVPSNSANECSNCIE